MFFRDCLSTFNTTPIALIKTNNEVEPAFWGTPQSECFEGERKNRVLSECANLQSTSKTNECFDAGNPVGGIEPVNKGRRFPNPNRKRYTWDRQR